MAIVYSWFAKGRIKGDLVVESLQDTSTYEGKQSSTGFSADIGVNPASSSASLNIGKTDIDANHKAVREQSGIFTGNGGFDIEVGGKTTLTGGAITTTDKAIAEGKNKFSSAGGVETTDIDNVSEYTAKGYQVGITVSGDGVQPGSMGFGNISDNKTSTTKAGISGFTGAGHSGISTDNKAEYAGIQKNVFDKDKVTKELNAQIEETAKFNELAPKAVAEFADKKIRDICKDESLTDEEKKAQAEKWSEGGTYRAGLHALSSAFGTGSVAGTVAGGATAIAIPKIGKTLREAGYDEATVSATNMIASVGLGAVTGDKSSVGSNAKQTQNNYLSHEDALAREVLKNQLKQCGSSRSPHCEMTRKDLIALDKKDKQSDINLQSACGHNSFSKACEIEYNKALDASRSYDIPSGLPNVLDTERKLLNIQLSNTPYKLGTIGPITNGKKELYPGQNDSVVVRIGKGAGQALMLESGGYVVVGFINKAGRFQPVAKAAGKISDLSASAANKLVSGILSKENQLAIAFTKNTNNLRG